MSNSKIIKTGSRRSRLAVAQVEEIILLLKKSGVCLKHERVTFDSSGDQDKTTPLTSNPADDFFTDSLDEALLNKKIDIAIHSAKDLPKDLRKGLEVFALTKSLDETDAFVGRSKLSKLKPGSRIGTSSLLRRESIKAINPSVRLVDIRGTINERLNLLSEGKIDGLIVATCALKRLGLMKHIQEILPFAATPLQGQLAVVGRAADFSLKKVLSTIDVRKKYGKVTLVGAGPGDPELITLKGMEALKNADAVFYDYLADSQLLKYAKKAKKIYVGKRKGEDTLPQSELSKLLRQRAEQGQNVVRLKGGDPLIFGRGGEEIEYLRAFHIPVEVIPGVSSATGIPSSLGLPLTARGISSSVAFISGHGEDERNKQAQPISIPKTDTIVFLMGLTKLPLIVESLSKCGWPGETPIVIISKGTRPDEKIISGFLENIEQSASKAHLEPPALIIAGQVVKFWKNNANNDRILYLGTNAKKYSGLGNIVHLPLLKIEAVSFSKEEREKLKKELSSYDGIIFTSRFAIESFFEIIPAAFLKKMKHLIFATIGEGTARALKSHGIQSTIVAAEETSQGLLKAMVNAVNVKGKKFLFPRSSLPNPYLRDELTKKGAFVKELTVYRNTKPAKADFSFRQIGKVIFTSPSAVKNFLEDYGAIPSDWQIFAKGLVTQAALKSHGYESEVFVYE